jgi:hypothetical protein
LIGKKRFKDSQTRTNERRDAMDKDREQKVLSSLYDRLLDAVTYSPDGKSAPFRKEEIYFQMCKNQVLDPADFANTLSPANPNGDMRSASLFSAMVDALPTTGPLWADSGKKVSDIYKGLVANANTATQPSKEQKEIYQQAYAFLNTETQTKDFKGNVKKKTDPSDIVIAYDDARAAYITAVGGYRSAYNGYDLDQIKDQRAWNAVAPGLQLNLDQAWNQWNRAGKAEVEDAQNALSSTINDAVRYAIDETRRLVSPEYQMAGFGGAPVWLPSYALPTSWAQASSKASKLTFTSSYLNKTESSNAHEYSAAASGSWGLWHASAEVSGKIEEKKSHMDAQNLTLEAELIAVSIKRPWFNPLLLSMRDWWVTGIPKGGISNGDARDPKGVMPLVPTGFVVSRNVKITADFSEEDKKFISNSISTKASGGWGPFSISGSYSNSSSKSDFQSKFDGGSLQLPGLQLVAWISAVTPASPPLAVGETQTAGR